MSATDVLDAVPGNTAVIDGSGAIVAVNRAWNRAADTDMRWEGADYLAAIEPDPIAHKAVSNVIGRRSSREEHIYECETPAGNRWFRMIATPLADDLTMVTHIDVTDERERAMALTEHAPYPLLELDRDLHARYVTGQWEPYTGTPVGSATGRNWLSIVAPDELARVRRTLRRTIADGKPRSVDARTADTVAKNWVRFAARPLRTAGRTTGLVVSIIDISRDRRAIERIRHVADHDGLTGLLSRARFDDRLADALDGLAVDKGPGIGVLFIDIDDFKVVNDTHGHDAGDTVITTVARRLEDVLRSGDVPCRYGGDEFVVLIRRADGQQEVAATAERIRAALSLPIDVGQATVQATVSVGGIHTTDAADPDDLLRAADTAMYRAKDDGKDRVVIHTV